MNSVRFSSTALSMVVALAFTSAALAASVSLIKKVPAGALGNFNYTYSYTCRNGSKGEFTLSAANDNEARNLAQQRAEDTCGE